MMKRALALGVGGTSLTARLFRAALSLALAFMVSAPGTTPEPTDAGMAEIVVPVEATVDSAAEDAPFAGTDELGEEVSPEAPPNSADPYAGEDPASTVGTSPALPVETGPADGGPVAGEGETATDEDGEVPGSVDADDPADAVDDKAPDAEADDATTDTAAAPETDAALDAMPEDELDEDTGELDDDGTRSLDSPGIMPMVWSEGGSGQYQGLINWIQWGDNNNEIVLRNANSTKTVTSTQQIGASQLVVSCTASGLAWHQSQSTGATLTPPLVAYKPGSWAGDALDDLYNIGGPGQVGPNPSNPQRPLFPGDFINPNQMVIGLGNPNSSLGPVHNPGSPNTSAWTGQGDGANMSFDFACTATLDGDPLALQGLVFADAESSSSRKDAANGPEWVQASTTNSNVTWRIIERYRTCTQSYATTSWANGALRLGVQGEECVYQNGFGWPNPDPNGSGPMSIAFMEGATSARVGLQGRGYSAVAVGYVLSADFGDAQASYGEASALFQQTWSGGEVPSGTTNVSAANFALATNSAPTHTILGTRIDADGHHQYSDDADADDNIFIDDEDGLDDTTLANNDFLLPEGILDGGTYTLDGITCSGPQTSGTATVAGWIDWNGNGTFDVDERAQTTCASGVRTVSLTWAVPEAGSMLQPHTYMRLRIAANTAEALMPTGISRTGEVEDYKVHLPARLRVEKQWVIDGEATAHGGQPDGMVASPTLAPDPEPAVEWGVMQRGHRPGDIVTIGEVASVDPLVNIGCRITDQTLSGDGIDGSLSLLAAGNAAQVRLPGVLNHYVVTNTVECLPGEIAWTKTDDAQPASLLGGTTWRLSGPAGEFEVADCTSGDCEGLLDEDPAAGAFKVSNLPWGDYTLQEVAAPDGYVMEGASHAVTIGEEGHRFVLGPFVNARIPGSVVWGKVDATSEANPLAGSVWMLTLPGGETLRIEDCVQAGCAGGDLDPAPGRFLLEDLAWGTYVLVEAAAPPGGWCDLHGVRAAEGRRGHRPHGSRRLGGPGRRRGLRCR